MERISRPCAPRPTTPQPTGGPDGSAGAGASAAKISSAPARRENVSAAVPLRNSLRGISSISDICLIFDGRDPPAPRATPSPLAGGIRLGVGTQGRPDDVRTVFR